MQDSILGVSYYLWQSRVQIQTFMVCSLMAHVLGREQLSKIGLYDPFLFWPTKSQHLEDVIKVKALVLTSYI